MHTRPKQCTAMSAPLAESRLPPHIVCPVPDCTKHLRNRTGYHKHLRSRHPEWRANPPSVEAQSALEDAFNADQAQRDTAPGQSPTLDSPRVPPLLTDACEDNCFLLSSRRSHRSSSRSSSSESSSESEAGVASPHRPHHSPEADNAHDEMEEDVDFGRMP